MIFSANDRYLYVDNQCEPFSDPSGDMAIKFGAKLANAPSFIGTVTFRNRLPYCNADLRMLKAVF